MSGRSRIRPRTKVYDTNYQIGESMYKSAIDRLDRKYSGRPTSPVKQTPSVASEILERHAQAFADDDLSTARRRAEKHITEDNLFDGVGSKLRPLSGALDGEFEEQISNSLLRIQARKKMAQKMIEDVDMENTFNNLSALRMVSRTDKMLDSVGLNESSAKKMIDDSQKRLSIKMSSENSKQNMTKWSALKDEEDTTCAAALRAKRSKARLNDLEDEMEQLAERQAARERRVANLRAMMADNAEDSEAMQVKSARIVARTEKKTVTF